eukprot:2862889-Alexandrium_andersonii.AAC.1
MCIRDSFLTVRRIPVTVALGPDPDARLGGGHRPPPRGLRPSNIAASPARGRATPAPSSWSGRCAPRS